MRLAEFDNIDHATDVVLTFKKYWTRKLRNYIINTLLKKHLVCEKYPNICKIQTIRYSLEINYYITKKRFVFTNNFFQIYLVQGPGIHIMDTMTTGPDSEVWCGSKKPVNETLYWYTANKMPPAECPENYMFWLHVYEKPYFVLRAITNLKQKFLKYGYIFCT